MPGAHRRRHRAVFPFRAEVNAGDSVRLAADAEPRAGLFAGGAMSARADSAPAERMPLRVRLALYGLDGVTLLVLPAVLFVLALFIYPFLYGLVLSFQPKKGGWLANYATFFSDPFLYDTDRHTLRLAVPATLLNRAALDPGRAARAADAAASAC